MFELLLPVALGMLGGGIGLALAGRMRRNRQVVLEEADALQAQGKLRAAASSLEQALKSATVAEAVFIAEARYRLCGLYVALGQWQLAEQVCQELLESGSELGLSGKHDVLRHLARSLDEQGQSVAATAARAQADTLVEKIPDTAYRLFARQERLVRHGQYREALALQEELLTSYPERVSVETLLCYTAFTAQHAGYPQDALRYVSKALARPRLPATLQWEAHRVGYHAAEAQHDWQQMLERARALKNLADEPRSRRYLANALLLNNHLEESAVLLTDEDIGLKITLARLKYDFVSARRDIERAPQGASTTLLCAAIELEAGEGARALATLETIQEPSVLCQMRRAWALALLGIPEVPPDPDPGDDTQQLEACAQAHWHRGAQEAALAVQEHLLQQSLAPAFRAYHEAVLKQWKIIL